MNIDNLIVVEYSLKDGAFHKQTVKEMLEMNLSTIVAGKQIDYKPIYICASNDLADTLIKIYQKDLNL